MEKPVFPGVRHFRDGQPKAGYFSKNPPPRPSLYYLTHFKPISQRRKFDLGHLHHFLWFYWIRAKIQYRGTKWGHGCLKFHFLTALAWGKASKQPLSLWILASVWLSFTIFKALNFTGTFTLSLYTKSYRKLCHGLPLTPLRPRLQGPSGPLRLK